MWGRWGHHPGLSMQDLKLPRGEAGARGQPDGLLRVRSVHTALRAQGPPEALPGAQRWGDAPIVSGWLRRSPGLRERLKSPDRRTCWAEELRCGSCPHGLCDPGQISLSLSLHRLSGATGPLEAAEGGTRPPGGPPSAHTLLSSPDYFYRAWSKFWARAPVWVAQDWGGCGLSVPEIILASGDELMRPKPSGPAEASALGPM